MGISDAPNRCQGQEVERDFWNVEVGTTNAGVHPARTRKVTIMKDVDEGLGGTHCSPALVQEVVSILRDRGIEATPQQIAEWADLMVKRKKEMTGKHTDARQWLAGVKHEMKVPTMYLHLHFGDAR